MMLKRKFSERFFDLILAGISANPQQLIIIFFAVQATPRLANILYMQESPSPSRVIGAGAFPSIC
jgi:hypothetical protein